MSTQLRHVGKARAGQVERLSAYVKGALADAAESVANAPPGQRNDTLFKQAAAVAGLIHHGIITKDEWRAAFMAAGGQAGLDTFEIYDTLNNALKAGTDTPRDLPDNMINGQMNPARQKRTEPRSATVSLGRRQLWRVNMIHLLDVFFQKRKA